MIVCLHCYTKIGSEESPAWDDIPDEAVIVCHMCGHMMRLTGGEPRLLDHGEQVMLMASEPPEQIIRLTRALWRVREEALVYEAVGSFTMN